jgi:hypothetical protein
MCKIASFKGNDPSSSEISALSNKVFSIRGILGIICFEKIGDRTYVESLYVL